MSEYKPPWQSFDHQSRSMRNRVIDYIDGTKPIPSRYYIGIPCLHGHDHKGQTVRYVSSHSCVVCDIVASKEARAKKRNGECGEAHMRALRAHEERQDHEDDDPLF